MENATVGVAGLGLLGRGIVSCLLAHGLNVVAFTPVAEEFAIARAAIQTAIEELVERAGFPPSLRETWQQRYTEATTVQSFTGCSFVIESIVEDAAAKQSLFASLEQIIGTDIPIASNTSALPISLLQQHCLHPERILGMHWAEPAHATRFLELIRGEQTSDAAMQAATALASSIGKDPCIVQKDIPGFIANRIGYAMYREACHLLETGVADAATIDRSFRNSVGLWASVCGPFQWIDLTGGPALYGKAMSAVLPSLSNETEIPQPLRAKMDAQQTGIRSGEGFYTYTPDEVHQAEQRYRDQAWRVHSIGADCEPPA